VNEKLRQAALQSYEKDASENDVARLEFFREVWKIQSEQSELIAAECGYEAPPSEEAEKMYWAAEPFFLRYPVVIKQEDFARVLKQMAQHLSENAGFEELVVKALDNFDWDEFAQKADLELAGSGPPAFVNDCLERIDDLEVPVDLPATIFASVPTLALRAFLEKPAEQAMDGLKLGDERMHSDSPTCCPACGSKPSLSLVGEGSALQGSGRTLFCTTCGTEWDFERIRCARCGSKDQTKLNYFNIEGDEAHRLQTCSDCGDYLRMVYQGSSKNPICPDVEDVVMARLDMVANDDRFKPQMDES
jgi:FdhE protein